MKITKEQYDVLSATQQALFKAEGDGYSMIEVDTSDVNEVERLRKHNETLLAEKKAEKLKKTEAEEAVRLAAEEAAAKSGDVEKIKEANAATIQAHVDKIAELNGQISSDKEKREKALAIAERNRVASVLTTNLHNQQNIALLLANRVKTKDGKITIYDDFGNETVNTIENLIEELKTSARFASLISAPNSSGAGAGGTGGASTGNTFTEMSEKDRMALATSNPLEFERLSNDQT